MNDAKRRSFANAVVEIRALEKRMLPARELEHALEGRDIGRVEKMLRAGGYPGVGPGALDRSHFDALLREAMEHFAGEVLARAPDPEPLDMMLLEYDIYNIKALLMSRDPEINFQSDLIRIPARRAARYRALASGADEPTAQFHDALFARAQALYRESGAKAVQQMLDRAYFARLIALADAMDVPACTAYARAKVDFYNIMALLRIRGMAQVPVDAERLAALHGAILVDGGAIPPAELRQIHDMSPVSMMRFFGGTAYSARMLEGINVAFHYDHNLSHLEKLMDDHLTELMRSCQFVALGPEPLLGYLHGRRIEMINVRLVLSSILHRVPRQTAMERLRESYA